MPKITAALTSAIVAVLILTGCAAASDDVAVPGASETESVGPSASEAAEPLVASTPTIAADGNELLYIEKVRELLAGVKTQIPDATDQQLLAAGAETCERYEAGEDPEQMSVIEGETRNPDSGLYVDTLSIVSAARLYLCPD